MSFLDVILTILTIIGSLGLFLYGMIMMSEALQKVAGKRMRGVLSSITSNDLRGVTTGLTLTAAIQSSSATTVMIVSFVNAGLISLRRSLSLIMGANIGTTVTAWIIVLLGFGKTFNISWIILPMVALSLPLLFSGRSKYRSWAEFIIGVAILFLGLQFLKTSIPVLDESSAFVQQFKYLVHFGFLSVLLFVGIGIMLTVIFQSSSAVMALTFVIAVDGWIPYDIAAAMVLGENLGTTLTANIAALVANKTGKRSAFFHFLFNLVGAIWALLLFHLVINGLDLLMDRLYGSTPTADPEAIPFALAIYHSSFNILNTLLFAGFLPAICPLLLRIIPDRGKKGREKFYLKHIGSSYLSTSELSMLQAKKEAALMARLAGRMFSMVPVFLLEKEEKPYEKLYKKIRKYEKITDRIQVEISTYLTKISESKLSDSGTEELSKLLRIIDELENIGDACQNMAISIYRKNKDNIYFIQDIRDSLNMMFESVEDALEVMIENMEAKAEVNVDRAVSVEHRINEIRNSIRKSHIENLKMGKYNFQTGLIFNDLVNQCEKIGDHAINVTEVLSR
jgi:phosphate:Na+ symporter